MKNKALPSQYNSIIVLFILAISLGFLNTTFASIQQNNDIQNISFTEFKGKVIDNNTNKPLVFAEISIVGTNIGTITNKEGVFSLKVPDTYLNKQISRL